MAIVSLDSPSCEVPCLILHSVVYQDVTRQAKGLPCLKYDGALKKGLAHLSQCNSGWFCHSGAARIWWDNYCAMQADGHVISWEEFRNAFRAHHIPEGLMERKLNEFLALTVGV
jgi:hypothetical protein